MKLNLNVALKECDVNEPMLRAIAERAIDLHKRIVRHEKYGNVPTEDIAFGEFQEEYDLLDNMIRDIFKTEDVFDEDDLDCLMALWEELGNDELVIE